MHSQLYVELPDNLMSEVKNNTTKLDEEFELRHNNRVRALTEADLQLKSTPRVLQSLNSEDPTRTFARAVVKDISRTGIGLYYHSQLFPQEMIEVSFQNRLLTVLVVRCRFISNACYEVGGKVLKVESLRS